MAEDGCINNAVFQDLDILGTFSLPEINISNTATFGNSIQNDLIINSTIKMPLSNDVEHTEGFQLVRQTDRSLKFEPKANDVFKTIRIDNQELINASGLEDTLKLVAGKNMTIETDTSTNPNTISFSSSNGSNVQNIYKTIRVKNNDLIPNTSTDILEFIEGNDIILNVNENNEDTNIYESIIKYNDNLTDTSGGTLTLYNIDDNLNEVFTVLSSTETELEYQCKIIYTDDIQNATSGGTIILHTGSTQVIFTLVSSSPSNNEFIIGADADATGTNIQNSINANSNFSCTIDTSTNTLTITNNANFVYTNTNSHTFTTGISSVENFVTKECFRTNNLEDTAENIRVMINNHPEFTANLNTNSREIKVSQTISQNNPTITDNVESLLGVISITNFTQVIRELSSITISLNQNIESDLIIGNYNNNLLTVNSESFFNNSVNFNNTTFYNNDATFNNLINLNNIQINNNQIITSETDQDLIINPNGIGKLDISASLDINSNNIENVNNLACSTITFGTTEINENEISILNNHTITSAELNILDGDTTPDEGLTLENDDKLIITDITDGTDTNIVKQIKFTKVKDYIESNATQISGLVTVGTLNNLSVTGDITVNTSSLKVDTSNSRLGIGTSTPSEKLHLSQDSYNLGPNIQLQNTINMYRQSYANLSNILSPLSEPSDSTYFTFSSWNDNRFPRQFLYINRDTDEINSGSGAILGNDLAIEFGYSNYFYHSTNDNTFNPSGPAIRYHINNTEKMCIDYQGNVGIGTTNPISKLDIQYGGSGDVQNNITDVSRYNLNLSVSDGAGGTNSGGICITDFRNPTSVLSSIVSYDDGSSNRTGLNFNMYNGSSLIEGMRIDSNGNLGIGTTDPSAKLHIRSNTTGQNSLLILENNTTTWGGNDDGASIEFRTYETGNGMTRSQAKILIADPTPDSSGDADLVFQTRGTILGESSPSVTEKMRISNLGNVGIGTNDPTSKLHVNGEVRIDGNVGIGTNTPGSYKLNVNGTANISGDVDIGGSTNITGSLTSNSTTVNDLTINSLNAITGAGVLVNNITDGDGNTINTISKITSTNNTALVYQNNAFAWVGFGTIASGGVNVNDLGILNTPLDGDFLIGLDRNNTFINNSVSKFYQEIDIIDSILRISTTTQGNGDLILSSEPYDSNDNNPYLKVTDASDFNILTDRLNLRDEVNTVVTNKVVESDVNLLIEDNKSRLQLISSDIDDDGSYIALSNAPSSGDQKNWVFHHSGSDNSNKLGIYYKTNNNNNTLHSNSNIGLTLDTSGNVGIGTTSPSTKLHIHNNGEALRLQGSSTGSQTADEHTYMSFYPVNNTDRYGYIGYTTSGTEDLSIWNQRNGNLKFSTNNTEIMRISNSGNIGMGTNNPNVPLHIVNSTSGDTITIVNSNTSSTGRSSIFFGPNGNYWELGGRNSNSGDLANKFYLYDRTNGGTRLVVDTSGNVGIGTPSPTQKLHVHGNIRAGSSLYVDANTYYGASTRQMVNLYNDDYGIGVQSSTTYFRSGGDFQFYKGGTHHNSQGNAGGGTKLLSISGTGQTTINGDLEVNGRIYSTTNPLIGQISFFAGSTPPHGWLECNGASISRSTYSELYSKLSTTYGSGNGSTTFNLPDFRGYFLRCWHNTSNGPSPSNSSSLGSSQSHQSYLPVHNHGANSWQAAHSHNVAQRRDQYGNGNGYTLNTTNGDDEAFAWQGYTDSRTPATYTSVHNSTAYQHSSTESRPHNYSLLCCIRYE